MVRWWVRSVPGWLSLSVSPAEDTEKDINYLVDKIAQMRIFSDADGKFNISAMEIGAEVLLISQFTLLADTRKAGGPSFIGAAHHSRQSHSLTSWWNACGAPGSRWKPAVSRHICW